MAILVEFLFRLTFGLALAMATVPSRWVTSGYYRVHLYVLLGFSALASVVALSSHAQMRAGPPVAAAVLCYFGAVCWLYEKRLTGKVALILVSLTALGGSWLLLPSGARADWAAWLLRGLDPATAGLLMGSTLAAMFLGHWYLNHPGMRIEPLGRLVGLIALAVLLRATVCGIALALEVARDGWPHGLSAALLAMHWLAGIFGTGVVAWMTWETLKIPNTQSATGILYVGVITTFLGELASQLLSVERLFPL